MLSVKLPENQSAVITVMTRAVIKASRGLLRDFGELEKLQVSRKNYTSFVTNADINADKILKTELSLARPDYAIISEESSDTQTDKEYTWIIDPLDGTVNFMHGFPHWSISVALKRYNEIVAAITYDPVANEMFAAEKDRGAFLNDMKIRVSSRDKIQDSIAAFREVSDEKFLKIAHKFSGIRKTGSTTLNMAYLAAARLDAAFFYPPVNIWDIASGLLLVKEAGGVVVDWEGNNTNDCNHLAFATNQNLLKTIIAA